MPNLLIENLIQEGERLIRVGQPAGLAGLLQELNFANVPRAQRLPIANLCRRAGLFSAGLRLLTPVVRPEVPVWGEEPSEHEVAEYAALLMKIGSLDEAMKLLRGLNISQALLYLGFCHMHRWEHAEAAEYFRAYLCTRAEPYSLMIARVNLIASLISLEQNEEAGRLIEGAMSEASAGGYNRLLANLHELRTQLRISAGDDRLAEEDLDQAEAILRKQNTNDQLYLLKWRAVIAARRAHSPVALQDFKKMAIERGDWESAREADFQILKIAYDKELHHHLVAGTPWAGFHRRLAVQEPSSLSADFFWGPGNAPMTLDLQTGKLGDQIACPPKILAILRALSSDFYAPRNLGSFFAEVFPGEHFHILHSPNRVHQLLWRTRNWLRQNRLQIEIEEMEGRFALKFLGRGALIVARGVGRVEDIPLEILRRSFSGEFSSREAGELLKVSEATIRRTIQRGIESGIIVKLRRGREIRYGFSRAA